MGMSAAFVPRFAACAALTVCACSKIPLGAMVVESVDVSDANLAGNPDFGVSSEQARLAVKTALEGTRKFAVRERTKPTDAAGARARLEIESARRFSPGAGRGAPTDREFAEVAVLLELLIPAPGADYDRLIAEGLGRQPVGNEPGAALDPQTRAAAFGSALAEALRDASGSLVWQLQARKKSDAALLRDLKNPDARVRDYAIRALADRRNAAAVPYLIGQLDGDSILMVRRAMGALVAIGDRRAVRPLIDLSRRRPPQLVAEIIYALGSLGGPEVEAFLYTLESGSPDEEVRRAATEAFTELMKKRDQAASASGGSSPPAPGHQ